MIRPSNHSLKVYLYASPMDMRKQIDGLATTVEHDMHLNPSGKSLFVFMNKRRDKIKVLVWEKNGYVLWYKRLEKHRFAKLKNDRPTLSVKELNMLLDGYDIDKFKPHDAVNFDHIA